MSRGVDDATAGMYLYGVLREEELPLSGHERTELVHLCTVGSFQGNDQEPDVVDEDNDGGGDIPYTEAPIDCSALA